MICNSQYFMHVLSFYFSFLEIFLTLYMLRSCPVFKEVIFETGIFANCSSLECSGIQRNRKGVPGCLLVNIPYVCMTNTQNIYTTSKLHIYMFVPISISVNHRSRGKTHCIFSFLFRVVFSLIKRREVCDACFLSPSPKKYSKNPNTFSLN